MLSSEDFIAAFTGYNEAIYNYIFYRVNYSRDLAQDLAQEVFLKVWKQRESFDEKKASLKTWIFVIARNTVIDHYRRQKDHLPLDDHTDQSVMPNLELIENKVMLQEIWNKLKELHPLEKEVLVLRYQEDIDIRDIALIIGKNYAATKVFLHRSLQKLKNLLNK